MNVCSYFSLQFNSLTSNKIISLLSSVILRVFASVDQDDPNCTNTQQLAISTIIELNTTPLICQMMSKYQQQPAQMFRINRPLQ